METKDHLICKVRRRLHNGQLIMLPVAAGATYVNFDLRSWVVFWGVVILCALSLVSEVLIATLHNHNEDELRDILD